MSSRGQGAVLARIRDARGSAGVPVTIARQVRALEAAGGSRTPVLFEEPQRVPFVSRRDRRRQARELARGR